MHPPVRIVAGSGDTAAEPAVLAAAVAAVKAYMAGQADSATRRPADQITAWRVALRTAPRARRGWRQVDPYPSPTTSR